MDSKAFNKIYTEAEEALAGRQLTDALQLTATIFEDTPDEDWTARFQETSSRYETLLRESVSEHRSPDWARQLDAIFRDAIVLLQEARATWSIAHKTPYFGDIAGQLQRYPPLELERQIRCTTLFHVGEKAFHEALDAAFCFAWCVPVSETAVPAVAEQLRRASSFARRTLVGGLLMGLEDVFSVTKLELLLELGRLAEEELNYVASPDTDGTEQDKTVADANDFYARVAVALVLVYQRYQTFLRHFPQQTRQMHAFFASAQMRPRLPMLLKAFVVQSLTDRVGKSVEDIVHLIKETLETNQHKLAGSGDERKDKEGEGMAVHTINLQQKAGRKFFRQMADYAERIDALRRNGMDVNASNFVYMKQFPFFDHPAHWYYPFYADLPDIREGTHTRDGKPDNMALSIMAHSHFCDSDSYSFACMMTLMRRKNQNSVADALRHEMGKLEEENPDFMATTGDDAEHPDLNPFTSPCQDVYRSLRREPAPKHYTHAFASTDDMLLPLLPLFDGIFDDISQLDEAVDMLLLMDDSEHAVILLNYGMEHFVTTATALAQRGYAYMKQKRWRRAISDFQQSLILEDNADVQAMMTRCYVALSDWSAALPLLQAEDQRAEGQDAGVVEEMARCLLQMERWDEAVGQFFRLEFMEQHLGVAQRGIAWCSLHQGKYQRAENYYRKIIDASRKPSWEDCLNLGHALWLQGRSADARQAYRKFVAIFNRSRKAQRAHFRHWSEALREDARTVLAQRYSDVDLALMIDAITLKDA